MQLCFVFVHDPRETYFVDDPLTFTALPPLSRRLRSGNADGLYAGNFVNASPVV
jgi:hypothetical protein